MSTDAADWRAWPDEHKRALRDRLRLREAYPPVVLRPKQVIGDHPLVVLIAGRRSGKTLAAAEWLAGRLTKTTNPGLHAVVAPTYGQARDVCIEQPRSGLLDALARRGVDVARTGVGEWQWNRTIGELRRNGTPVVRIDSLEDGAQRIRGHAVAACWVDELRLAPDRMGAWALDESIRPALSGSEHPQMVVTTTPAPTKLVRQVMSDSFADVRRMTIWDNAENLPDRYLQEMRDRYAGTRIGRQELEGELLEDVEGALWRRDWIEATRTVLPPLLWQSKVMGLDPSDGTEGGAEQGIAIAGIGSDWNMYVTHSDGLRVSGLEYCKHAVVLAVEEECSRIVVERNHGGTYLIELLEQAMRLLGLHVAVQVVTASRDKRARAEPVAALYEQGKVRHLGYFLELEEQMCLAGETLIATERGEVPIRTVVVGDRVWTRAGLRRVLWAGKTGTAPVGELRSTAGAVTLTATHPVYVAGRGFVPAKCVGPRDTLLACGIASNAERVRSRQRENGAVHAPTGFSREWPLRRGDHPSSGAASVGISAQMATGSSRALAAPLAWIACCIVPFGSRLTVRSPTALMSTTSTATHRTGVLKTWSRSAVRTIARCMRLGGSRSGQKINELYTASGSSLGGRRSPFARRRVESAVRPTKPSLSANPTTARHAAVIAPWTAVAGSVPVYNLMIEGQPEFFANGVLVHNCSFTGLGPGPSPDRMDAAVWTLLELKGRNWHGPASEEAVAVPYTDRLVEGGAVAWE